MIDYFKNKCLSLNPLVIVLLVLFLISIALTIIRINNPNFNFGGNIGGSIGTLKGNISIEGFNNCMKDSDCNGVGIKCQDGECIPN